MKKEKRNIDPKALLVNTGQIDWLPANPRTWTQADIDKTSRSIAQDTDFLEDRPILAVAEDDVAQFVVFAGNLRTTAAKGLALKSVPVVVYFPETEEDREAVKRRAMKDNGTFGTWDYDALANEWDDLPLADFGVPVWNPEPFTPNLNPTDRPEVVTQEDIKKAEEILQDEITPAEKQFMEVTCPHCGKTITIKI